MYTNDMGKWQDMEHEFAGFMTEKVTPEKDWDVDEFLDALYTWVLEYGRVLEQEDYV